jgi:hypothetical protein
MPRAQNVDVLPDVASDSSAKTRKDEIGDMAETKLRLVAYLAEAQEESKYETHARKGIYICINIHIYI